ncbi:MAG: hypothetical protein ACLQU3_07465 [Limisphaerales bacterium]
MKTQPGLLLAATLFVAAVCSVSPLAAQTDSADPGWPRLFKKDKQQLTIYQPQVDYWNGYTNLHFRCAIAVKGVSKQERFGVLEADALTVVDHANRVVAIVPVKRELRFANVPEKEAAALRQAVDQIRPPGQVTTLSLDRVLAYLDPATQPVQRPAELNLDPPKIFYSSSPAILVIFMGEPQLEPVETNRTDLMFVMNSNWDVLYDTASQRYFLLNGEGWLTSTDVLKGPWTPAKELPPSLYSLPANDNWAEARQHLPGKPARVAPTVFATTEPAEMILTDGKPNYAPIRGTRLMRVNNTESVLFLHTGDGKYYLLVAGRWFRGGSLGGPWSAASNDLPPDFAQIPDSDPAAFVKASVPETREAKDAVMLASIPITTTVNVNNPTVQVIYSGAPQFVVIPSTTVQYAVNTANQVFLVNGGYYCCSQGVWFYGASAIGPWRFCTSVPAAIYTIPPSNPNYNVTYVVVQSSTPTTVVYCQTAGYSGEYVAKTGVLMFGAGIVVGAIIANSHSHYYYPPPCYYSYGCRAVYHYGYGGYYCAGGKAYGPYGGAGYVTAYNPRTGTYVRASYAYGPYGSASRTVAYNPYTGGYASASRVNTGYGSAGRATAYNPYTGTYRSAGYASTPYGTASGQRAYNANTGAYAAGGKVTTANGTQAKATAYNPNTGKSANASYQSTAQGSSGKVTTSTGAGAAGYNTANSQGKVVKTESGDVYASKDGNVYKKDANGGWSSNSGSGWNTVSKPQPASTTRSSQTSASTATSGWSRNQQSLESQAQARSYGNRQSQQTSQFQSSGKSSRSTRSGGRN